ncbi:MobA/MobL family protein [Ralstonia pseudosolanacearum]|uniref:MobA/MobL family protein n=1 Tax=Ralstonia pseudosolanacearum TaxID=1310165 RepID=UPI0009E4D431|nr:MobA/MobL family protein [Ralstonia pseudosolanacearum]
MALYHFSASEKPISRSGGRSATAAAAYRAGARIADERTGLVHDFTRKRGVVSTHLLLPGGRTEERTAFWNRIEAHHKRGDAVLAREVEVALPHELPAGERERLALTLARELSDRYGVAADVAIHEPGRGGDQRNHHAHILMSACSVSPTGELGNKANELDPIHCRRAKIPNLAREFRPRWKDLVNESLAAAGSSERVDDRTLAAQGIDREPTRHLGPSAVGYERRTGRASKKRMDFDQFAAERLAQAKRAGELERQANALDEIILDLTTTISQAKAERDRQRQSVLQGTGVGISELRERLQRSKLKLAKLEAPTLTDKQKDTSPVDADRQIASLTRRKRDDDFEP